MGKLRIVSDGTRKGTQVLDERGEQIEDVSCVSIFIDDDGAHGQVSLDFLAADVVINEENLEVLAHVNDASTSLTRRFDIKL